MCRLLCHPSVDHLSPSLWVVDGPVILNEAGRITAITAAKSLAQALETPQDAITQQLISVSLSKVILQTSSFSLLVWNPNVMLTIF